MATTAWLANVRPNLEHAVELVPPHWIGDAELSALADRFEPSPDATYIERTRWDALSREAREGVPILIPDAAFEVLSKSDSASAIRRKVATYLRDGVRLVVMIDPYRRRTYVGRAGDRDVVDVGDVTEVNCAPVMPGLMLDVASIVDVG